MRCLKLTYLIAVVLATISGMAFADSGRLDALQRIKANYRESLIRRVDETDSLTAGLMAIKPETEMSDQVVIELHERYPFDVDKIGSYLELMDSDGSWRDIDYADTRRSGWDPKRHADRLLEMVKVYLTPGTPLYASRSLNEMIHRGLGYWFSVRPECLNWWQNEIGVPKTLGPACLLIEDELSEEERQGIVDVLSAAKIKMTGQNKVWLAGNVLLRGLLQNDPDLVGMARDTIASEICVGRAEGIKSDWSFHQHGPQQQFGNYGLAFLTGMGFYYRLFKDTPYQFDSDQEEILRNFIEKGYKWTIWHRNMDVSALGRQLFHNAQLHKAYALAFTAADFGIGGFPADGNLLKGHRHFDESDYTVHRSADWMATVKMSSSRVIGTEVVNEDNLLGYYLGDGATFYYARGDEYREVFPFLDWRKIPGVTAYEDNAPMPTVRKTKSRNRSGLVGGLGSDAQGMSVMNLDRDGLTGRKAWVFTDDFVLCLGSGITSDSLKNVTTAIDTRLKRSDFLLVSDQGCESVDGKETHASKEMRLWHDGTGYVVLPGDSLHFEGVKRTGSWNSFMKMYRPVELEGEVVSIHLSHGVAPQDASYEYFVLPASTPEKVRAFDPASRVRIHRNDGNALIVEIIGEDPVIWIAAYDTCPLTIEGFSFTPPAPGIFRTVRKEGLLETVESTLLRI